MKPSQRARAAKLFMLIEKIAVARGDSHKGVLVCSMDALTIHYKSTEDDTFLFSVGDGFKTLLSGVFQNDGYYLDTYEPGPCEETLRQVVADIDARKTFLSAGAFLAALGSYSLLTNPGTSTTTTSTSNLS